MHLLARAWSSFWFADVSLAPLAYLRISFGMILLLWGLTLALDVDALLAADGIAAELDASPVPPRWPERLLPIDAPGPMLWLVWSAFIVAAGALVLGWHSRIAAIVSFVTLVILQDRNPHMLNGADNLLRVVAFYLVLAPTGAWLSIDRWRREGAAHWERVTGPAWPLRLLQLQLCALYFFAALGKVMAESWREGTALSYAWRAEIVARVSPPDPVVTWTGTAALTWMTLLFELVFCVAIWSNRLRPWVLASGILLHVTVHVMFQVGFFSLVTIALYAVFLPERWTVGIARRGMQALRRPVPATLVPPDPSPSLSSLASRVAFAGAFGCVGAIALLAWTSAPSASRAGAERTVQGYVTRLQDHRAVLERADGSLLTIDLDGHTQQDEYEHLAHHQRIGAPTSVRYVARGARLHVVAVRDAPSFPGVSHLPAAPVTDAGADAVRIGMPSSRVLGLLGVPESVRFADDRDCWRWPTENGRFEVCFSADSRAEALSKELRPDPGDD